MIERLTGFLLRAKPASSQPLPSPPLSALLPDPVHPLDVLPRHPPPLPPERLWRPCEAMWRPSRFSSAPPAPRPQPRLSRPSPSKSIVPLSLLDLGNYSSRLRFVAFCDLRLDRIQTLGFTADSHCPPPAPFSYPSQSGHCPLKFNFRLLRPPVHSFQNQAVAS